MVMPRLLKVTNFNPPIFGDIVNLAFLRSFIWVLTTDSINKIFGLEFKFSVQMCELMTRTGVVHKSSLLHFVG